MSGRPVPRAHRPHHGQTGHGPDAKGSPLGRGEYRQRDEGAALILAIGFVLLISAIMGALAALITSSFNNRGTLEMLRDREFAADAAIEDAIALTRGELDTDRSFVITCDGYSTTLNSFTIRVDCQNASGITGSSDNLVLGQRNVIFEACVDVGQPCEDPDVIIRAQVDFEQAHGGPVTETFIQSWSVNK